MEKFFIHHARAIFLFALALAFVGSLEWDWTHFKSFVSGAIIGVLIYQGLD